MKKIICWFYGHKAYSYGGSADGLICRVCKAKLREHKPEQYIPVFSRWFRTLK